MAEFSFSVFSLVHIVMGVRLVQTKKNKVHCCEAQKMAET